MSEEKQEDKGAKEGSGVAVAPHGRSGGASPPSRMFRPHDWRVRELTEGRWDHHPVVREEMERFDAALARSEGK
jgi:hypothetical protein